jgi:hypothetical protein
MKRGWKLTAALLAVFIMLSALTAPAFAGTKPPPPPPPDGKCESFYLQAVHGINGEKLGLPMALPVDVYVNGGYAFTFEFKDTVGPVMLPAGEYTITVNLAGTDTQVMSLGPAKIPGCVKVVVVAKLVNGVPTLLPKIRELTFPSK